MHRIQKTEHKSLKHGTFRAIQLRDSLHSHDAGVWASPQNKKPMSCFDRNLGGINRHLEFLETVGFRSEISASFSYRSWWSGKGTRPPPDWIRPGKQPG